MFSGSVTQRYIYTKAVLAIVVELLELYLPAKSFPFDVPNRLLTGVGPLPKTIVTSLCHSQ